MQARYVPPAQWRVARPPEPVVRTLEAAGHAPVLARLLAGRGVADAAAAARFLDPSAERLAEPLELNGLEAVVGRLQQAARGRESVLVVGDYDVDGIAAAALLQAVLTHCGVACEVALPSRRRHGYGLHPSFVERAVRDRVSLLVTIDCGSNAPQPIGDALAAGLDVVVLDHHLPVDSLPAAALHVNPHFEPAGSPFLGLAASGLAFELSRALADRVGRPLDPARLASVACLGTIADMVPLQGENRVLSAIGLAALGRTPSPGLRSLIGRAGLRPPFSAQDVAFGLGPRLNAPGRLADPDPALRLLLTRQRAEADRLADEVETANRRRRAEEVRVADDARRRFDAAAPPGILVAWDAEWHPGVLGIAAGRLARELGRPTVLLAIRDGVATGSGRSVAGIDLHAYLQPWRDRLQRFGGHAQAVGLTADADSLATLATEWVEAADWPPEALARTFEYEIHATPEALTPALLAELERLRPWGQACPEPLVRLDDLRATGEPRRFGNDHLELRASDAQGRTVRMVGWRWASRRAEVAGSFDVLGCLERDRWNDGLRLRLADTRPR